VLPIIIILCTGHMHYLCEFYSHVKFKIFIFREMIHVKFKIFIFREMIHISNACNSFWYEQQTTANIVLNLN